MRSLFVIGADIKKTRQRAGEKWASLAHLETGVNGECSDTYTEPDAERGTISGTISPDDHDFAKIVAAWASLPDHVKATILTLIETSV